MAMHECCFARRGTLNCDGPSRCAHPLSWLAAGAPPASIVNALLSPARTNPAGAATEALLCAPIAAPAAVTRPPTGLARRSPVIARAVTGDGLPGCSDGLDGGLRALRAVAAAAGAGEP
jgi:hypothetical protein